MCPFACSPSTLSSGCRSLSSSCNCSDQLENWRIVIILENWRIVINLENWRIVINLDFPLSSILDFNLPSHLDLSMLILGVSKLRRIRRILIFHYILDPGFSTLSLDFKVDFWIRHCHHKYREEELCRS